MDDIILTGTNDIEIARLKRSLAAEFEIKDLGSLRYFLGMEFARSKKRDLYFTKKVCFRST